jgi:hypothetical protein
VIEAEMIAASGYIAYQNVYRPTPEQKRALLLARLADKETRMDRRMARRREQITKRNWMMVGTCVFWLTAPVVAIAFVSAVWRFCAWVVAT